MKTRFNQWFIVAVIGLAMVFGSLGNGRHAHAQDATPTWEAVIPDASLCQAQPRSVDDLVALFANATPAAATTVHDHVEVPTGQFSSPTLAAAVTATVHQAVACLNAGEFLRFMALLTDRAILNTFPWIGAELANGNLPSEITNPTPLPADMVQTIISVADVRTLADGRIGAFLVLIDPASGNPGPNVLHLTFTHADSLWLIDDVIEFSSEL